MGLLGPAKGKAEDEEKVCLPDELTPPRKAVGDVPFFFFFFSSSSSSSSSPLSLVRLVTIVALFVAGAVLGLSFSTAFTRYYPSLVEAFIPSTLLGTSTCGNRNYCYYYSSQSLDSLIHPAKLTHAMTDDELFWRASMVPRKTQYPFNRVPKVAFLFLARGPLPLAPLWERFFQGHLGLYSVYVHSSPDYALNVSRSSPFYGRRIPSEHFDHAYRMPISMDW